MHPHRHEALQPVGHRRQLHAQQLLRDRRFELIDRGESRPLLPEEQSAVDLEVQVVRPIKRVEVQRPPLGNKRRVGRDRGTVRRDHPAVVTAQHIKVGRHVLQMPRVRHQSSEQVRDRQRPLGGRRHLHQVDVHVQEARMLRAPGGSQRGLKDRLRLQGSRPFGRLPGALVPQLPRREVHQRLGVEAGHVEVAAMRGIHLAHGGGILHLPGRALLDRTAVGIPGQQGSGQRLLDRRAPRCAVRRNPRLIARPFQDRRRLVGREELPRLVVVRAEREGDPPVRKCAVGVEVDGPLETLDRFLVVEPEGPDQPAVHPGPGRGNSSSHGPRVFA
ncbi:MAG: hypothetical protein BWY91_02869 [bacterium ADurb.BinA028]|nr:MAG: hypothetical protein BWY91_02869 [bacterium ADurb.BinA028]